jgi:riboflavin transporter FmnP
VIHTVKVIATGFALLLLCLVVGRQFGGVDLSALVFIPLWVVGAGINMWFGVKRAGYSVREELPFFFVVFLIPAVAALLVYWRYVSVLRAPA